MTFPKASRLAIFAILLISAVSSAYVAAAVIATRLAPESGVEAALSREGFEVKRATATALTALAEGRPPGALVLIHSPPLPAVEREAIAAFVEEGGALWILGPSPGHALPHEHDARTFAGLLYASNGSPARIVSHNGGLVQTDGLVALDLASKKMRPLVVTPSDTFRDTNGNGKLDAGEPAGAFAVAASASVGEGVILLASFLSPHDSASTLVPPLARATPERTATTPIVVVDSRAVDEWAAGAKTLLVTFALAPASVPAAVLVAALGLGAGALVGLDRRGVSFGKGRGETGAIAAVRQGLQGRSSAKAARMLALLAGSEGDR